MRFGVGRRVDGGLCRVGGVGWRENGIMIVRGGVESCENGRTSNRHEVFTDPE